MQQCTQTDNLDVHCSQDHQQQVPLPHKQQRQTAAIIIVVVVPVLIVVFAIVAIGGQRCPAAPPLPLPVIIVLIGRSLMPGGNKFRMLLMSHPSSRVLYLMSLR